MPTPPYGRATAPWVRFCHILHSTHHSARSRRTRAVSDSTASSGRNSASSRSPALVLGCPFLSFSSTFRSRHQSLYLSSMVGYSNPEIQICKSAKDTPGATLTCERGTCGEASATPQALVRQPREIPPLFSLALALSLSLSLLFCLLFSDPRGLVRAQPARRPGLAAS